MGSEEKQRTDAQNRALHLWLGMLADQFNAAGYEQKLTIGTIDVPWTMETVKIMYKKIAYFQFGKIHTADLTTKELTEVSETLMRALAEAGMEHIPFPSMEEMMLREENVDK